MISIIELDIKNYKQDDLKNDTAEALWDWITSHTKEDLQYIFSQSGGGINFIKVIITNDKAYIRISDK